MESSVWNKALALLKYDTANIDMVTYDSILCKMSVVFCDDNMLVLAARDEFSLKLVKGQKLSKIIEDAIKKGVSRTEPENPAGGPLPPRSYISAAACRVSAR